MQGGNAPGCVIVRFWGETDAGSSNAVNLRAVLDDDIRGLPNEVRIGVPTTASVARGYEFIFRNVAPGGHSIRMQWQSANGNSIFMQEHTTMVLFR